MIDREGLEVLGPAPLFRLKDRFRSVLLVKSFDRERAVHAAARAVEQVSRQSPRRGAVAFSVDVDPQ
jgi:primosomal protein N' (replication factor Y)